MQAPHIRVGSDSKGECPHKRRKRRRRTVTRGGQRRQRQRSASDSPKPRNAWNHPQLEEARKESSPRAFTGAWPTDVHIF